MKLSTKKASRHIKTRKIIYNHAFTTAPSRSSQRQSSPRCKLAQLSATRSWSWFIPQGEIWSRDSLRNRAKFSQRELEMRHQKTQVRWKDGGRKGTQRFFSNHIIVFCCRWKFIIIKMELRLLISTKIYGSNLTFPLNELSHKICIQEIDRLKC